jgi:hypothetical protein
MSLLIIIMIIIVDYRVIHTMITLQVVIYIKLNTNSRALKLLAVLKYYHRFLLFAVLAGVRCDLPHFVAGACPTAFCRTAWYACL